MDATTAELIDTTVFKAFRNSTMVAVAHRLDSVAKHCDSVAVMSEGKVVERGRPRLVKTAGSRAYYSLGQITVQSPAVSVVTLPDSA